jgi:hypothetical protein
MEYRFYDKGISAHKVVNLIRSFFEAKSFDVSIEKEAPENFLVMAKNVSDKTLPKIAVKVYFNGEFLSVNFLNSHNLRSNLFLSSIFGAFGGNIFFLKQSKVKERIDRLEEDFWKFIDCNL